MADDVLIGEDDGADSLDVLQEAYAFQKAGILAAGEIDLGRVTGHDELGVHAHSGEEHLELGQIRVLGLVQDDTCPVQRPASHVGQRGDLDRSLLDELLQSLGWNHVAESVVQWLEVRIQLVFQVSWQESQPFTGLDGRTGQDDPLYLTVFQRPDSQSDRYVGLAGSGRADGKDEVILEIGLDHLLLGLVAGLDRFAFRAVDDDGLTVEPEVVGRVLPVEDVLHVEGREIHLVHSPVNQLGEFLVEFLYVVLLAVQMDLVASGDNLKSVKIRAELFEYLVPDPEDLDGVDGIKRYCLLHYQSIIPVSLLTLS